MEKCSTTGALLAPSGTQAAAHRVSPLDVTLTIKATSEFVSDSFPNTLHSESPSTR